MTKQSQIPGMVLRVLADAVLIQVSLVGAIALRLYLFVVDGTVQSPEEVAGLFQKAAEQYTHTAAPLTLICLVVFFFTGFYTYGRYYQGRYKVLVVLQAVTLSYVVFGFLSNLVAGDSNLVAGAFTVSRGGLLLSWIFSMSLLLGARVWNQVWSNVHHPHAARKSSEASGKRVLVIGGGGYIGSALIPHLLKKGYHVRLLDIFLFGRDTIADFADHPRLEIMEGDFRHVENVVEAMPNVDTVVHLGAIVGDPACSLDPDVTIDVNLTSTHMIAHLAKAAGVKQFIFASTCSVYGACDEVLNERSLARPVNLYGHTKLASENVLQKIGDAGFGVTVLRFATIYGLSGRTRFDLVVNLLAAKAKLDGEITIFGGDQWRPFVHVDDAARAVAMVVDAPPELVRNEIFNVGSSDQNYTIGQVGELVHELVVGSEISVSDDETDLRNYRVDFRKIHKRLGFEPHWNVQRGIEQVLEAIASGAVTDYRDPRFSNYKFFSAAAESPLKTEDWAHVLLKDMTQKQS